METKTIDKLVEATEITDSDLLLLQTAEPKTKRILWSTIVKSIISQAGVDKKVEIANLVSNIAETDMTKVPTMEVISAILAIVETPNVITDERHFNGNNTNKMTVDAKEGYKLIGVYNYATQFNGLRVNDFQGNNSNNKEVYTIYFDSNQPTANGMELRLVWLKK